MRRCRKLTWTAVLLLALALASGLAGCGQSRTASYAGFPSMLKPPDFVSSYPAYAERRQSPPSGVVVELAKPISENCRMTVWLEDRRVDARDGGIMLGSDRKLHATLKASEAMTGMYRVEYTVAWKDGGTNEGRFYFLVERTTR